MKKKILILGNAQSIWVKEYIEHVLLPTDNYDIYVTTQKKGGEYYNFYVDNNINLVETDKPIKGIKNSRVRTVINILKATRDNYDIIHVHYVPLNIMSYIYSKIVFRRGEKIILSFWGSDLLQSNTKNKWQKSCIEKSDYVTVSGSILKEEFVKQYPCYNVDKIKTIKFGISVLPYIDSVQQTYSKERLRKILGLSENKVIISIGYNARESQQHLKVIEEFKKLPKDLRQKFSIVLQFGTGISSPNYKTKLICSLKDANIEYMFTEGYLDKEQTAILRSATDIFIHAQETDALSASVQEYLYSGAFVINPKWIDYKELKDLGVQYREYNSFEELPCIIEELFEKNSFDENVNNKKLLSGYAGWDLQQTKWIELYEE